MYAAAAVQGHGYYEKASGPVDVNLQTSNLHPFISYTCFSFWGFPSVLELSPAKIGWKRDTLSRVASQSQGWLIDPNSHLRYKAKGSFLNLFYSTHMFIHTHSHT